MKKIALIILACLLIGGACGYFIGYSIYIPKIESYVAQINDLVSEVSRLVQINCNLEQTVVNQEGLISSQQAQIGILENETSSQKTKIANKEAQISSLESEKSSLQKDVKDAQTKIEDLSNELSDKKEELYSVKRLMNDILNISVTQNYQWDYRGYHWEWDLPITLSEYVEYCEKPRPITAYLVDMATDPGDDYYINSMVQRINEASLEKHFTEIQKLNFVISFVQSLPYTVDIETKPYDEYPRYPIETLFDRGGDCEDTSILVAALLDRMGYDVALLHLSNAYHMAVGVVVPDMYGLYYDYNGKHYYYLETTGEGWEIGQIPSDIKDTTAYMYPL